MNAMLSGYRILDLTDAKGHLCGRILGDMGADVIKIEPPEGDPSRNWGPFFRDEPNSERSLYWFFANANKRGITLNLKTADGKDIFRQLVKGADVILESFAPGYMAELGIDYLSLRKIKPDIIVTSIAPFGQTGPYVDYKVTDLILVSMGGMAYVYGDEDRAPVRISIPQAYFLGGQHAAVGTLFALYHRELTGEGQWVDVSIQEAIMFTLTYVLPPWEHFQLKFVRGGASSKRVRPDPPGPLTVQWTFPCKDGMVVFASHGGSRIAVRSARALVAWANDEGYAVNLRDYHWETWDSTKVEQSEQDFIDREFSEFFATKDRTTLFERAVIERILLAPVSTIADVAHNPQFHWRGFWVKVFHDELGVNLVYPGAPVKVSECPLTIHRRAPRLGEHNKDIYHDELGLSSETLRLLKAQGVI